VDIAMAFLTEAMADIMIHFGIGDVHVQHSVSILDPDGRVTVHGITPTHGCIIPIMVGGITRLEVYGIHGMDGVDHHMLGVDLGILASEGTTLAIITMVAQSEQLYTTGIGIDILVPVRVG